MDDLRMMWPGEAGEAVATAWAVLVAEGYEDPESALVDLVRYVAKSDRHPSIDAT